MRTMRFPMLRARSNSPSDSLGLWLFNVATSCVADHFSIGVGRSNSVPYAVPRGRECRSGWGSRMFQEQRAYRRVAMRAHVTCIVDSETSRGVSWNLSQAGIQVEVSNLKPKEAIQLSFRLPVSGVAVDAVGSLVWQHNRRHGIRFTHVGPQSRRSILQYVREHTTH